MTATIQANRWIATFQACACIRFPPDEIHVEATVDNVPVVVDSTRAQYTDSRLLEYDALASADTVVPAIAIARFCPDI
jgi:hypothetical protein